MITISRKVIIIQHGWVYHLVYRRVNSIYIKENIRENLNRFRVFSAAKFSFDFSFLFFWNLLWLGQKLLACDQFGSWLCISYLLQWIISTSVLLSDQGESTSQQILFQSLIFFFCVNKAFNFIVLFVRIFLLIIFQKLLFSVQKVGRDVNPLITQLVFLVNQSTSVL